MLIQWRWSRGRARGVGQRAFYRWLSRDYAQWFPRLPERTRLFRRLKTHWQWAQRFLAEPSLLGVIDSYGVELIHPVRRGRNPKAWIKPGISNHRWIVGGKLCLALNRLGQIVGWGWATANAHDTWFHPLVEAFEDRCVLLADTGFHAAAGDPPNLKICPRGRWNVRMLVETVYSMLTVVSHTKKMRHRRPDYFKFHLALAVAAFNSLVAWNGLPARDDGNGQGVRGGEPKGQQGHHGQGTNDHAVTPRPALPAEETYRKTESAGAPPATQEPPAPE